MNKIKVFVFLSFIFTINICFAERVISTKYFNDIAIREVDNHDVGPPKRMEQRVLIYKLNTAKLNQANSTPQLEEILWTITPKILPANEDTCLNENIEPCEEIEKVDNPYEGCFNSCIQYGPTVLSYDEKNQKLYLLASTIQVGQGGGPHLGFVADLKNKTIKYLKVFEGFIKGNISPDGKYILLEGINKGLELYNTETNQEKSFESKPVTNLHWINNNQFSYQIMEGTNSNKLSEVITKHV